MSFYQKYRPQRIAELDLFSVRESLLSAIGSGNLPHAWLFLGPRGAGKTSAARILAKTLNCEKNKEALLSGGALVDPCDKCEFCVEITKGVHPDVIEIDAASHRSIDDVRELRERVGLSPVSAMRKVYIIDEVHMLSGDAFNALLKTIEEPPAHVVFVLCTTEAHKVPATIVSRCRLINFVKASKEELVTSLSKVVVGEGVKIEVEVLELLSEHVDGSFREAHKLLEQIMAFGQVSRESVLKVLGLGSSVSPLSYMETIAKGDLNESLLVTGKLDESGVVWSNYIKAVLDVVRLELRASYGVGKRQTDISNAKLVELAQTLLELLELIKKTSVEVIAVEVALIKMGGEFKSEKIVVREDRIVEKIEVVEVSQTKTEPARVVESEMKIKLEEKEVEEPKTEEPKKTKEDVVVRTESKVSDAEAIEILKTNWGKVLETINHENQTIAGLLRQQKYVGVEDGHLLLEVGFKFHKDQLENETKRLVVEDVLARMGTPLRLKCLLKEKERAVEDPWQTATQTSELVGAVEDIFGVA